jgi:hypothetical protein
MAISTSWIHGNGLTIESPIMYNADGQEVQRLILTPSGPGAWVERESEGTGAVSWLHLPLPIGKISRTERCELLRVFLLFQVWGSFVDVIHVYDGYQLVAEFNNLNRGDGNPPFKGNFLLKSRANTFQLDRPYSVKRGIGLSLLFKAPTGPGLRRLFVAAAGAEVQTYPAWLGRFRNP